jgi:hypothetical protein
MSRPQKDQVTSTVCGFYMKFASQRSFGSSATRCRPFELTWIATVRHLHFSAISKDSGKHRLLLLPLKVSDLLYSFDPDDMTVPVLFRYTGGSSAC